MLVSLFNVLSTRIVLVGDEIGEDCGDGLASSTSAARRAAAERSAAVTTAVTVHSSSLASPPSAAVRQFLTPSGGPSSSSDELSSRQITGGPRAGVSRSIVRRVECAAAERSLLESTVAMARPDRAGCRPDRRRSLGH